MSTHSSIACMLPDGRVVASYCHFDGYVSHMMQALNVGNDSYLKAYALATSGEISSLGTHTDGPDCKYDWTVVELFEKVEEEPHWYKDFADYSYNIGGHICDSGYQYIFMSGNWYVRQRFVCNNDWQLLEKAAAESEPYGVTIEPNLDNLDKRPSS